MGCYYDNSNVFSQILKGILPYDAVYESADLLAFYDKYPDAPTHVLVIPKGKYLSYDDFILKAPEREIVAFFKAVREITHKCNLQKTGYRLVTNHGKDGEQVVPHFHLHILGGKRLGNHVNLRI